MRRRYRNPPVTEALCEVFYRGSEWDLTIPGEFYEHFRERFPKKRQRSEVEIQVQVGPGMPSAFTKPMEPRSQFEQEDGTRLLQVGRDLVVVNQLKPYPSFDEWRPVVLEAAGLYQELARPAAIARIGVRYINQIQVPESAFKMEHYFQLHPEIPAALGPGHGRFMMRVEIPPLHKGHLLVVTFGSAPSDGESSQALMLDLYDMVTEPGEADVSDLDEHLAEGHDNIERAFESIITDAARELFQEITDEHSA